MPKIYICTVQLDRVIDHVNQMVKIQNLLTRPKPNQTRRKPDQINPNWSGLLAYNQIVPLYVIDKLYIYNNYSLCPDSKSTPHSFP
jgi:hypothetical protein